MSNGGRRAELDGVRGIAILLVLVGHAWNGQLAALSAAGVALFFALSGYLITGLLLAEREKRGRLDLRRFYARRFTRLAPPLFVMLAVMAPVLAWDWRPVVASGLWVGNYAQMVNPLPSSLHHVWSLGVEEQFYLVWPLALCFPLRRGGRGWWLGAALGALLAWRLGLTLTGHAEYAYYAFEAAAPGLLVGCFAALVPWNRHHAAFATLWAVTVGLLLAATNNLHPDAMTMLLAPAFGLFVAVAGRLRAVLSWRPLAFCGVASYSLYLWHVPVAWLLGGDSMTPATVLVGALVGVLAWALVERPLMAWRCRERVPSVVAEPSQAVLLRA